MEDKDILDLLVPVFSTGLTSNCLNKLADGLKKSKCITDADAKQIKGLINSKLDQKILQLFKAIKKESKSMWNISFKTLVQSTFRSEKKDSNPRKVVIITEKAFEPDNLNLLWILKSWHSLNESKNQVVLKNSANFMLKKKELDSKKILLHICNYVAKSELDSETVSNFVETMKSALSPVHSEDNSDFDSIMSSQSSLLPGDIVMPGTNYKSVETKLEPLCPMLSDILTDEQIRNLANDLYNDKHISKGQHKRFKLSNEGDKSTGLSPRLTEPGLMFKLLESLKLNVKKNWENDFLKAIKKNVAVLYELMSRCLISNNSLLCYLCQNWELFKQKRDIVTQVAMQQLPMFDESKKPKHTDWLLYMLSIAVKLDDQSLQGFVKTLQSSLNDPTATLLYEDRFTERPYTTLPMVIVGNHSTNSSLPSFNETRGQQRSYQDNSNGSTQQIEAGSFDFNSENDQSLPQPQPMDENVVVQQPSSNKLAPSIKEENISVKSYSSDEDSQSFASDADSTSSLFLHAVEIEDKLVCLITMLGNLLTSGQVKRIAHELTRLHHLSRTQYKSHFHKIRKTDDTLSLMKKLADGLKRNAQDNWKKDFVKAIKILDNSQLTFVLERWLFSHKNGQILRKLFNNWENIEQHKLNVITIAEDMNIVVSNSKSEMKKRNWFLWILTTAMSWGDNYLFQFENNIERFLTTNKPQSGPPRKGNGNNLDPINSKPSKKSKVVDKPDDNNQMITPKNNYQERMECEPSHDSEQTKQNSEPEEMDTAPDMSSGDLPNIGPGSRTAKDESFDIVKQEEIDHLENEQNDVSEPYQKAIPVTCGAIYPRLPSYDTENVFGQGLPPGTLDPLQSDPLNIQTSSTYVELHSQTSNAEKKNSAITKEKINVDSIQVEITEIENQIEKLLQTKTYEEKKIIEIKECSKGLVIETELYLNSLQTYNEDETLKPIFEAKLNKVETKLAETKKSALLKGEELNKIEGEMKELYERRDALKKEFKMANSFSSEEFKTNFDTVEEKLGELINNLEVTAIEEEQTKSMVLKLENELKNVQERAKINNKLLKLQETTANQLKDHQIKLAILETKKIELKKQVDEVQVKKSELLEPNFLLKENVEENSGPSANTRSKSKENENKKTQQVPDNTQNTNSDKAVQLKEDHFSNNNGVKKTLERKREIENSEKVSYADKAKGKSQTSKPPQQKKIKIIRQESKDIASNTNSNFDRISSKGKIIVEFQAILDTQMFDNNQELCLYDVKEVMAYPMFLCPVRKQFTFIMDLEKTRRNFIYKYLIRDITTNELYWEFLPSKYDYYNGIRNRKITIQYDQVEYFMSLDVIQMKEMKIKQYEAVAQNIFPQFLPPFNLIQLEVGDFGMPLCFYIVSLASWFKAANSGIKIIQEHYFDDANVSYIKSKASCLTPFIHQISEDKVKNKSMKSNCKRILGMMVVLCLMEYNSVSYDDKTTKAEICNCLSLNDIDEDAQVQIEKNFNIFFSNWPYKQNYQNKPVEIFEKCLRKLNEVPEIVLVLPLYSLVRKTPSELEHAPGFRISENNEKKFKSKQNQKAIIEMAPKVCTMLLRFPSIKSYYQDMLSLESVTTMLCDYPSLRKIFDDRGIFKKIEYMWVQLAKIQQTEPITEEVFVKITNYFFVYLREQLEEIKLHNENIEKSAKTLLAYSKKVNVILNNVYFHLKHDVETNSGFISYTLQWIDCILENSHYIAQNFKKDISQTQKLKEVIQDIYRSLIKTFQKIFEEMPFYQNIGLQTIQLWNALITRVWFQDDFTTMWTQNLMHFIQEFIYKKYQTKLNDLLEFYAKDLEVFKPNERVSECFSNVVINLFDKESQRGSRFAQWIDSNIFNAPNMSKICRKFFSKQWKHIILTHNNKLFRILQLISTWKPAATILKILCDQNILNNLKEKTTIQLTEVKDGMEDLQKIIYSGKISVDDLQIVMTAKKAFVEVYKAIFGSSVDNYFEKFLDLRISEINAFYETKSDILSFLSVCDFIEKNIKLKVRKALLGNKVSEKIQDTALNKLVKCRHDPQVNPVVTFFDVPQQYQVVISQIKNTKAIDSQVVRNVLKSIQPPEKINKEVVLTINDVMDYFWIPTMMAVAKHVDDINNGTLSFQTMKQIFETLDNFEIIKPELETLLHIYFNVTGKKTTFLKERLRQINSYFHLKSNITAAKVVHRIQTKLDLKGNFCVLEVPLDMESKDHGYTLKTITEKLVSTTKKLKEVSPAMSNALETFLQEKELLNWLRENMKTINEVKVLSDLAMISAGQIPMQVDRVSCFSSAVMGFAPLIFDLPQTAGFNDLISVCEDIWKNIQQDPDLLNKWVATGKELEWLRGVKDLHGSVEKSSLTRAQKINTNGVYKIGEETDLTPTVENSMKLFFNKHEREEIKKNDNQKDPKEMSLSDLRDLQSRLMLIAGEAKKGKQDVDVFIKMLSSVENLTKAYVKLKSSGCLLFQNWSATVVCSDTTSGEHQTLSVYFDSESPAITSRENALEEVVQLTKVLNDAHDKWMDYLNTKRTEHYHLNHYNIHQLTYLCKQLAKCDEYGELPDQAYVLLSSVKKYVDFDEIVETLDEVTRITDIDSEMIEVEGVNEVSTIEKKRKVVRQLIQQDVQGNIAKAAVQKQSSRNLDLDECFMMSLEMEYEPDEVNKYERLFDQEAGFESNTNRINVMQDIVNDRLNLSLNEIVEKIQSDYKEGTLGSTITTICERYLNDTAVTSLKDSVSLEHLGKFMSMLSDSVPPNQMVKRGWPDHFIAGKPNLVLCPEADIWRSILSIYCHSPECELPSTIEVLVCTENTSSEEVELLLRRAMCTAENSEGNVFCLACADQLKFNVAHDTEKIFQQLSQSRDKNSEYRLIIITTSTQHYTTCCFDEFQVDKSFIKVENEIKEYLAKHLTAKHVKESASCVDPDQSIVRVVTSDAAGMGKSLYITRCRENLERMSENKFVWNSSIVRFLEKSVDTNEVINSLLHENADIINSEPHFIHLDITPSVQSGVYPFLFNLVFLGSVQNSKGVIWKREPFHFYAIEYTLPETKVLSSFLGLLNLLPNISCLSPTEVCEILEDKSPIPPNVNLMDTDMLKNEVYQRPFQYLLRYTNDQDLYKFTYKTPILNALECLQTLLKYCSVEKPSWSELGHFTRFLNVQLSDCEKSVFCDPSLTGEDSGLKEFKKFVVRFMIRMSQDFSTPSINKMGELDENQNGEVFELHQLRRSWESNPHPYLFFNHDRVSMSFVHFHINRNGNLCHPKTKQVIENNVMSKNLVLGLNVQRVKLQQDFDLISRNEKLQTLCQVFGVENVFDPDPTYELTTDNVLKMLAIHMRFRCGIPVIVMGETGCGKTRMIEFMCRLKAGGNKEIRNMMIVKVHGGITVSIIQDKVRDAIKMAKINSADGKVETILFLDEANTTEAIYAIKEVVCDGSVNGVEFKDVGLRIVAACNPYRKHSDEVIKSMEKSGLGFNVKAEDTKDRFGGIPMRHLVYRVISLPPSMLPLVWDFGQLSNEAEGIYIRQMVLKLQYEVNACEDLPDLDPNMNEVIAKSLLTSQDYMRNLKDLSSFVSLRDVERTIQSFKWFYHHLEYLNPMINEVKRADRRKQNRNFEVDHAYRALILSLGMCYHATLEDRMKYRQVITQAISNAHTTLDEEDFLMEIIACQNVFIDSVDLEKNIARNEALRENVFMIVVCAEMRIPLFLVGKPGSSKSLAKTVATDAMRGQTSNNELFKRLKQIQVLSFQCSPVSDAVGIETVFSQCAQLQKNQDLNKYVAVVVLDEIGLAEDSPKMPLKVLHPLLEAGSTQSSNIETEAYNKVGFVGISNWSLDPAKMNRGIFVTRGKPSRDDLHKTAKGIFESNEKKIQLVEEMIKSVTNAYLEIYENQDKEFFGLRDYYALLKMMFSLISKDNEIESYQKIGTLVLRNFSGHHTNPLTVFRNHLLNDFDCTYNINISVIDLIKQNLDLEYESRFLLLLTNQYAAISLLNKVMDGKDYVVIFGSSFPRDCDYTEICRNINRIKMCMESGKPVVLLNLQDLYESLYDALNQHYVTFAGQRYVDLGLGGHRVKCRIAEDFRLIVIEEKEVVYKEFPIPLINRLEKHIFEMSSVLTPEQETLVNMLKEWVSRFSQMKDKLNKKVFAIEDTFAGYQNETVASAILKCADQHTDELEKQSKLVLLQSASYDGVCRLSKSRLGMEIDKIKNIYFNIQHHDNLVNLLKHELLKDTTTVDYMSVFEITSFSHILNDQDRKNLESLLNLPSNHVMLINLQQFQTEQEYSGRLDDFFNFSVLNENPEISKQETPYVLLIQCTNAQENSNLISCAKYSALDKIKSIKNQVSEFSLRILICFLFTLERHSDMKKVRKSFTSFHSQDCTSIFVDELQTSKNNIGSVSSLQNKTILQVIDESLQKINEDQKEENCQLDLNALIRQCTPESVSKLINKTKDLSRNRVKIFFDVCFNNENISNEFFGILLNRILLLLEERETSFGTEESWVVTEACSPQALQEGGTFTNTLWLKLRKVTAIVLAKIISVVDVDNNLNILIESKSNHILELWLTIFSSVHYCKIMLEANFVGAQFIIENKAKFTNKFPFSRMILDFLYRQWSLASVGYLDNATCKNDLFFNRIEKARIHGFLVKAVSHNAREVLELFVHDLVHLYYKSQTEDTNYEMEFQAVQDSLISFFNVKRRISITHKNPLVEVFVLFMSIHMELIQFSEVVASCSDILVFRGDWVDQQELNTSFMLHALAFSSMVSLITEQASGIDKVDTCQLWKSRVLKVKQVSDKIIASGQVSEDIQTTWKHLVFVDLFIDQLIPTSNTNSQQYLSTLAPLAKRLWKGASTGSDMSGVRFLKIITTTLQGCTKDVRLKILCNWEDLKCKSCKADKVVTPVMFPCGHFICQKCVPVNEDVINCPRCRRSNLQDLTPIQLNKEQTKEYESFKNSCTSFFLEYLSTFCFPTENKHDVNLKPLDQKVFEILENLVICDKKTKIISPLQSNFDESPTARSYILQLLLRCNPELVQTQLNRHFQSMGDVLQDKTVLMGVYIQCIQDKLYNELRLGWNSIEYTVNAEFSLHLFEECQELIKNTRNFNQVQHLDMCAKLQFVTRECLKCMKAMAENRPKNFGDHQNIELLINRLCMFCKTRKYLIVQQYLIKCLCRRHGVGDFDFLLNNENYRKCLIPENLLPPEDADDSNLYRQSDLFILIGDIYTQAKSLFLGIASEDDLPGLVQKLIHLIQQSNDSLIQIALALSAWCVHGNVTNQLKMEAKNYIYNHLQLNQPGKINQQLFEDISKGELNVYQPFNATANLHYKVVEVISMAGIAFHNKDGLPKLFSQIIADPSQIPNMFLPTMPQSSFFEVKDVLKQEISHNVSPKAYMCPNNHVYFIGECTNPVQAGTCPECKCKIGGQKYGLLHEGNRVGDLTEASQAGYLLGESTQTTVAPERKLTKLSVCAIRICLHASLLLNARQNNNLNRILKINGGQGEVIQFLLRHLVKDLTNLGTFLGKSFDDTLIIVHQILRKIRTSQTNPAENNCSLASMKNRVIWEEMFQKTFLSLVFKDTEKIIQESQNALIKAGKLAEEPLQRLVFELNEEVPVRDGIVPWDHPNLWKYKVNIDMQHLRQKLEAVDAKAGGDGSILKPLLEIENLNYVQYIEDIAHVQSTLITRYNQRIDMSDSDKITLNDFLLEDENLLQAKLYMYITIWNQIRHLLEKTDLYNTNREYFREDMTLNSPISMCLPNNRGRGCCGLVLMEYLINIQNNLLANCRDNIVPKPKFELSDVTQVDRENLVCIEEERDLMPLVLANSQYEATAGNKGVTGITYNVGLLEKKVVEKFILRKAIINIKSIPRMQYPQDMGLGKEWKTINSSVKQVPLPQRMCTMIDENAEKGRTADICEAVRTLTLVIQFLAKLGGEPGQGICDYAEKDIMLPVDETNNIFIPKTAQIKHCLSLFERLSCHRALRSFRNGQNPFENILAETEDINDDELETELCRNLTEMNIQRLQFELNALLMLGPEANPDWSLSDVLLAYLEQKYDNEDLDHSWCEKLPEDILYKHAVHVFSLSIEVQAI